MKSAKRPLKSAPKPNSWRFLARKILTEIIEESSGLTKKEIIKKMSKAYPWGERSMYPYKAWLIERKLALEALEEK